MGDKYFPDTKEPHIHQHKGGITYTAVGHSHKNLVKGSKVYKNVVKDLVKELKSGSTREKKIAKWIDENV